MIAASEAVDVLVGELLGVLDEEISLLEQKTVQMAGLSAAMLDRDEKGMIEIIAQFEQTQRAQDSVDVRLSAVSGALGGALGCPSLNMRLGWLGERLPEGQAAAVDYRRRQIILLAERARSQHLRTALLLHECSRINSMLLAGLFPDAESVTTYGQDGQRTWRNGGGLVDAEM